jgi:hypothetical protein
LQPKRLACPQAAVGKDADQRRVAWSTGAPPLINALADPAEFLTAPGSGTEVRMSFDIRHDQRRGDLLARLEEAEDLEAWAPWRRGLSGDVLVTLLPVELLGEVLEPLTSALTARSRFSLERFSDVFLLTRAIAEHVRSTASSRFGPASPSSPTS